MTLAERFQSSNISIFIVGLFALVGFISSAVTIVQYFDDGSPSLVVKRQPVLSVVPERLLEEFGTTSEPGRIVKLADEDRKFYCEAAGTLVEQEKNDNDAQKIKERCLDYSSVSKFAPYVTLFDGNSTYLVHYKIENKGRRKAKGLKITDRSALIVEKMPSMLSRVQIARNTEGHYDLPDLNPGQKLELLVWVSGNVDDFDDPYFGARPYPPDITYDGKNIDQTSYYPVPEGLYSLYDTFGEMPLIIQIIMFLALGMLAWIPIIFIIQIVDALITGKPIADIFKSTDDQGKVSD